MPPAFARDELIADRFRIGRFLGQGGMGQVFEAEDVELGDRIALKVIRPGVADNAAMIERFKQEALLARQVTHPNVCRIFDLFQHRSATADAWGRPASSIVLLTMELLPGETLAQRLSTRGPLPLHRAVPLIRQMASALDAAHRAGIVHRDFKSANIMLVPEARSASDLRVVVTDFGLAQIDSGGLGAGREADAKDRAATTRSPAGTPDYLAPEVVAGARATASADIYALGVVIHEMVIGKRPNANDPTAVDGLPPTWRTTITRCLTAQPAARFATAGAVIAALTRTRFRSRARGWAAAAALLAVLSAAVVSMRLRTAERISVGAVIDASQPIERRPSVAVLGFDDVAETQGSENAAGIDIGGSLETEWIATALAEMMTSELAAGERLRAIPHTRVVRMKNELPFGDSGPLSTSNLAQVDAFLGAEWALAGRFELLESDGARPIRIEVRLHEIATGRSLASVVDVGEIDALATLVRRVGSTIRSALSITPLASDRDATRSFAPNDVQASRDFLLGLDKLRSYQLVEAIALLEKAVEHEPDSPTAHAALGDAWAGLGYDRLAASAARRAYQLSASLPREERLSIEGRFRETVKDWPRARDIYQALLTVFPDNPDHTLRLVAVDTAAGHPARALERIDALRLDGDGWSDHPRLDLAEAEAASARADLERQRVASRRVVAWAQRLGADSLAARGRLLEAEALDQLGRPNEAAESLSAARLIFDRNDERYGLAQALLIRQDSVSRGSDLGLGLSLEEALEIFREVGDRRGEARILVRMARELWNQEERLDESENMIRRATEIARSIGNRQALAEALNADATLSWVREEVESSVAKFEDAVAAARASGNFRLLAGVLMNSGNVLRAVGEVEIGEARYREALEITERSGSRLVYAMTLRRTAAIAILRHQMKPAREALDTALEIAHQLRRPSLIADCLKGLADVAIHQERFEEAFDYLTEAIELRSRADPETSDRYRLGRARIRNQQNRFVEAEALASAVADRHPIRRRSHTSLEARRQLIVSMVGQQRPREAQDLVDRVVPLLPHQNDPEFRGRFITLAVSVESEAGLDGQAIRLLEAELAKAEAMDDRRLALEVALDLGRAQKASGDLAPARLRLAAVARDAAALGHQWIARYATEALE